MINKKELRKKLIAMALAGSLTLGISGCKKELGEDTSKYDLLENGNNSESVDLSNGVEQIKEVKNHNFKLVLNYLYLNPDWKLTVNKKIFTAIKTEGLPENLEVYIDNIHTDTSIVSTFAELDGIKQDYMDDRIHNSLMIGFPISDTIEYYGCNSIEGMNHEFIEGFAYGCNGSSVASITEKRYTEKDLLSRGVWANRINTVIDLIIKDKNTGAIIDTVSVDSSLLVEANNTIEYDDGTKETYNREGNLVKTLKKTK